MGPVTRLVQTGIGLNAELKAAKKERKAAATSTSVAEVASHSVEQLPEQTGQLQISDKAALAEGENSDEDDLHFGGSELPVYQQNTVDPPEEDEPSPPPYTAEELAERTSFPPPPAFSEALSRLKCPIIIPQRRPGMKLRGFVRAYAPVLADHGIEQDTFLGFLKDFHVASQASPYLYVIAVGAGVLGSVPEPGAILLGLTIQLVTGTAAELQSRKRANTYLDRANEKLFKPRGLYCLIISFRPNDVPKGDVSVETVDTSKHALQWLTPPSSSTKTEKKKYSSHSGKTHGELELPETAPLIYPDTGNAEIGRRLSEDSVSESSKQDKDKDGKEKKPSDPYSARKVAQAYFDKRAQAKYAYKHPTSTLATSTPPTFASKYGDPTHPSVTSGYTGRLSASIKKESLEERQARKRAKAKDRRGGVVKRLLPESVLYMMIVNLPTEAEIEDARRNAGGGGALIDSEPARLTNGPSESTERLPDRKDLLDVEYMVNR